MSIFNTLKVYASLTKDTAVLVGKGSKLVTNEGLYVAEDAGRNAQGYIKDRISVVEDKQAAFQTKYDAMPTVEDYQEKHRNNRLEAENKRLKAKLAGKEQGNTQGNTTPNTKPNTETSTVTEDLMLAFMQRMDARMSAMEDRITAPSTTTTTTTQEANA